MTTSRKLAGLAALTMVLSLMTVGVTALVFHARAPSATTVAHAGDGEPTPATTDDGTRHACRDIDGRRFEWRWANVPFAASCEARPDKD